MAKAHDLITGKEWSTDDATSDPPEPKYRSFEEFVEKAPKSEIRKWCYAKAYKANRSRRMSGAPIYKVSAQQVMDILFAAKGRCCYCGSLCVEKAPTKNGKLTQWGYVGRRIGSLEHKERRVDFGDNNIENFEWCCNWCNTWPTERKRGATDHGGIQDEMK
ncbi:MAG: hypothetical protein ABF608_07040 [Sporolactobacillus sp.]